MGHDHHVHLHRRQHARADPLQDLEDGLKSLTAAAGQFFNGGRAQETDQDKKAPSTVYVTATWTGTGEFSLSTQLPSADPTTDATTSSSQVSVPAPVTTSAAETSKPTTLIVKSTKQQTTTTSAAAFTTSAVAAATTALSSIDSITSDASDTASAAAATATSASAVAQDTGLSGGAKAGIAIGVILGLILLAAAAFFAWRHKKSRDQEAYDFTANNNEKNPFSDHAADRLPPMPTSQPTQNPPSYAEPPAANPFIDGPTSVSNHGTMTSAAGVAAAAGLAGGAVVGAAAANARRNSVPAPLNINRAQSPALIPPPVVTSSPAASTFSESSLVPVVAPASGPPPRMHRVQMEFNPTMEDEVPIRVGEIVRIVRDFDDGWCTVEIIDRDRSNGIVTRHQQGVVPRTCLSRLPLKPRSRKDGPGGSPKKNIPQSLSPGLGRTQSPALVSGPRSMSPGPYGGGPQDRPQRPAEARSRSNSANDVGAIRPKVDAVGPSPMNPAYQVNKENAVELPIQGASPLPEASSDSRTESTPMPAPLNPSHNRSGSKESAASAPVSRKPVPKKVDA